MKLPFFKKTKKADLVTEIVTRQESANHWALMQYLPNPDPILKRLGKDISAYREILSDAHVKGCVRRRKAAIKGLEWRITKTDNTAIDTRLERLFNCLSIDQIITEILDACLFGYQPLEITWGYDNGVLMPVKVTGKPPEWFVFDEDNILKFKSKAEPLIGELLPNYKFLLATQEASYINPYGQADLGLCFWPAIFKKGGLKYWLTFIEKYGSPMLYGKHPRNTLPAETDMLLDSLSQMMGSSVAVIPDDASIQILESGSKGASSDAYDQFLHFCRSEIAIAILGQNQTTEAEANKASAQAGADVTKGIRDEDSSMVESVFNQLLTWICELNFTAIEPPKFELYEQQTIDKLQAERDELLTKTGARLTNEYFKRTYDLEDSDLHPQSDLPIPMAFSEKSPADFAQIEAMAAGHMLKLEDAIDHMIMALQDNNPIQTWLEPILNCIHDNDPATAKAKLADIYPNLDDSALVDAITRIIFVSKLWGIYAAQVEAEAVENDS